jgi:tripartite-type tricarboxylate transporter receptor subunit TctC
MIAKRAIPFAIVAIAACTVQTIIPATAQTYPTRPITIIVPFAAGGGNDVITRTFAQRLRPTLGQNVIVENITGANGSIGVARAAGDGYTLVSGGWTTFVANGAVWPIIKAAGIKGE